MKLIRKTPSANLCILCTLVLVVLFAARVGAAAEVTECDRLASFDLDFESVAPPVANEDLDREAADQACRAALAADPNNPRLKVILARVVGDFSEAGQSWTLLREAAQQDYPAALAMLGGLTLFRNFEEGVDLLTRAGSLGHPGAQGTLASLYWDQNRSIYDPKAAEKWAEKAAAQGDSHGQYMLGIIVMNDVEIYDLETITPAEQRGVALLSAASEQGHAHASWALGKRYEVRESYEEARRHYRRAAVAGLTLAEVDLARLIMEGLGGPVDEAEAIRLYCEAGEFDVNTAEIRYGIEIDC